MIQFNGQVSGVSPLYALNVAAISKDPVGSPSQPEDFAGVIRISAPIAVFSAVKMLSADLTLGSGAGPTPFTAASSGVFLPPQNTQTNTALTSPPGNGNLALPNPT